MQTFDVLTWPPRSLDLNPIEHVCALVKQKLNEYQHQPKKMLQLWDYVQASFHFINPEQCHSMPNVSKLF